MVVVRDEKQPGGVGKPALFAGNHIVNRRNHEDVSEAEVLENELLIGRNDDGYVGVSSAVGLNVQHLAPACVVFAQQLGLPPTADVAEIDGVVNDSNSRSRAHQRSVLLKEIRAANPSDIHQREDVGERLLQRFAAVDVVEHFHAELL